MMNNTQTAETLETLARILARVPADRFQKEALRMVEAGELPPAELLHRCGIRTAGATVLA
jgi:hypothetical protein